MRYDVEHQRNIAFDLLRLRNCGISLADYFEEGEPVIIYGMGFLGIELYHELKGRVNIVCFMDRAHDMEYFDGIPVFAMQNPALYDMVEKFKEIKAVITVSQARKSIFGEFTSRFPNVIPLSLYLITATLKLEKSDLLDKKQLLALDIAKKIIYDIDTKIDKIVVLGTSYTQLLSFLVLPNWQNTFYITDRFFPKKIVEKMTECNVPCLNEAEAGEFYDLTYIISDYAAKRNIPVYGHDHLFLSRAFLENPIILIEDGEGNYNPKCAISHKNMLDSSETYFAYGFDQKVKRILLTGLKKIPEEISEKTEYINPSEQWRQKNDKEKQIISEIFGFPYAELIKLTNEGRTILFLTEPYAHIGGGDVIPVEKMVDMYKEILSNYDKNRIIIKPHPADTTDYESLMPGYCVVSRQFPVQLIQWTEIPVQRVIVMHRSTCIHCFSKECEIDVYRDILLKYGLSKYAI